MSTPDKEGSAPDVVEHAGYSDSNYGPAGDTSSFDKRTPMGAPRSMTDELRSFADDEEESITNTSSMPTLKRSSLKRSDGLGRAAGVPEIKEAKGPSMALMAAAVFFFVVTMAVVGVGAAKMQRASAQVGEDSVEKTLDGVPVRKGVGTAPDNK